MLKKISKFAKYGGGVIAVSSAASLVYQAASGEGISNTLAKISTWTLSLGALSSLVGWMSEQNTSSDKKEKENQQLQQDYDALVHLDQELEAEIEDIYVHTCESGEQMKRYIDIYDKNMGSILDSYVAETTENTPLITISARFKQIKEVRHRFIDEERKLTILINDRPDDFDVEKATHVDYELFMEEKKLHHEKIRAQADLFFKSYEDFKSHMDAELSGKFFK